MLEPRTTADETELIERAVRADLARFRERCITRARQFAADEIDLHDAVDNCQQLAEALGLVIAIGQDAVQQTMGEIFGAVRKHETVQMRSDDIAASTIDAAEYLIRLGNPARLKQWLDEHSPRECAAILDHLE
jgi:hypothetical protein